VGAAGSGSDDRVDSLAPACADTCANQLSVVGDGACAGWVGHFGHKDFDVAHHEVFIDGEADCDVVHISPGRAVAAVGLFDSKGLGVDDPPLDLPQAVGAPITLAFHATVVHEAPGRGG